MVIYYCLIQKSQFPPVMHVLPRRDVCHSLMVKYLCIHIPDLKLKLFFFSSMVSVLTCPVLVKFFPLSGDHRLGQEAGKSEVPERGR